MQSFFNKEILIGFFPSDRDWWEDQWTVGTLKCLKPGDWRGCWRHHQYPDTDTMPSALIRMWLVCCLGLMTLSWCDNLWPIVVAPITIITITFHIISWRWTLATLHYCLPEQTLDVWSRSDFYYFVRGAGDERSTGWDTRGPLGAYRAIITRVLIGTKHYLFVRLLIKSCNKLREGD